MHDANGYVAAMRSNTCIHQYTLSLCSVFDHLHCAINSKSADCVSLADKTILVCLLHDAKDVSQGVNASRQQGLERLYGCHRFIYAKL
jgi:hypothetical protein